MSDDFYSLLEALQTSGHDVQVPVSWQQGRTVYGGLSAGLSLHIAQCSFADLPPLRSATINFIAPAEGVLAFKVERLRQGRNVSSVRVDMMCAAGLAVTSIFIFGVGHSQSVMQDCQYPEVGAPETYPHFLPEGKAFLAPTFIQHFETRLVAGARPVSGVDEGYICTWSRHKDVNSRHGEAAFLVLGDVLPPAIMPKLSKMVPISSINWTLNFCSELETDEAGWWLIEARLSAFYEGYATQIMRYWNRAGQLVAEATQCVAVFI